MNMFPFFLQMFYSVSIFMFVCAFLCQLSEMCVYDLVSVCAYIYMAYLYMCIYVFVCVCV